jgi:ankyrin repeat protein
MYMTRVNNANLQASLTALHIAAREGHIECVRALCVAGADINVKNKVSITCNTCMGYYPAHPHA